MLKNEFVPYTTMVGKQIGKRCGVNLMGLASFNMAISFALVTASKSSWISISWMLNSSVLFAFPTNWTLKLAGFRDETRQLAAVTIELEVSREPWHSESFSELETDERARILANHGHEVVDNAALVSFSGSFFKLNYINFKFQTF